MPTSFKRNYLVAAISLMAGIGQASAEFSLGYHNHDSGEKKYLTPATSSFSMSSRTFEGNGGESLGFAVITNKDDPGAGQDWELSFVAPKGQLLAPGKYLWIDCADGYGTKLKGRAPGMEIRSDFGPFCHQDPGHTGYDPIRGAWFGIRQLSRSADGKIASAEVVFSQFRYDSTIPRLQGHLTGVIRYNTKPLSLELKSEPGFRWGEFSNLYHGDSSVFSLRQGSSLQQVTYIAEGQGDRLIIKISSPNGRNLAVGQYQTLDQSDSTHAGFYFAEGTAIDDDVDGRRGNLYCYPSAGTLDIKRIETNGTGEVTSLVADFAQRCNGEAPLLRGTIRYN